MKTANNLIFSRVIAPRKDDEHLLNMALIGYVCDENDHPLHAVSIDCEPSLLGMPYFQALQHRKQAQGSLCGAHLFHGGESRGAGGRQPADEAHQADVPRADAFFSIERPHR